jgi:hypothetical protein
MTALTPKRNQPIETAILMIRGERVMLDSDLAELYGVSTAALNQALRRNRGRFPQDFMFQLTATEVDDLNRSQTVIGSQRHRNPRFRPYAFTEQGVAMLSSVLRSRRAVAVNIEIMRTFVRLRRLVAAHKDLGIQLAKLERSVAIHDKQIQAVLSAIRGLMTPPVRKGRQIGFRPKALKK